VKRYLRVLAVIMFVGGLGLTSAARVAEAAQCCSGNNVCCSTKAGECCDANATSCSIWKCTGFDPFDTP